MGHLRTILILFLFLGLGFSMPSIADEIIEDLIDLAESNDKIIAIINGSNSRTINLRPNEQVLKAESKGYLGAVLTSNRFLTISTSTGTWHEISLKPGEAETDAVLSVSPYYALLVTEDRAISFNDLLSRYFEVRLPVKDELHSVGVGDKAAVVITSSRAFGMTKDRLSFKEMRLRVKETVESKKVLSSRIVIRTSDRLLIFSEKSFSWKEHRL